MMAGTSANAVDAGRYRPERLCDAADRAFQQPVSASPYLADCDGRQPEVTAASAGPVRLHLQNGGSWRHLALGVAGWMRYTQGVDEQGNAIDVVDPMLAEFQKINAQYQAQTA